MEDKKLTRVEQLNNLYDFAEFEVQQKISKKNFNRDKALFIAGLILTVLFLIYKETSWFPKLNMLFFVLYLISGIISLINSIKYLSYSKKLNIDNKKTRIAYLALSIMILLFSVLFFFRSNIFYN